MLPIVGFTLLGLGIFVWLWGNRLWLLGAGVGAMLGLSLIGLVPASSSGWQGFLIVGGMAVLFGVLGFIGKAFTKLIAVLFGFISGGAVVISFTNLLGMSVSFWVWIAAFVGGFAVAVLFNRFVDWGLIFFASLLGSVLLVNGAVRALFTSLGGVYGSVLVVVLTVLGIFYHAREMK